MRNEIKGNDLVIVDHNYSETVRGILSENNTPYGEIVNTSMELGFPNYKGNITNKRNTHFFVTSLRDIMVIFGSLAPSLGNGKTHIWTLGETDPLSLYREQLEEMRFRPRDGEIDVVFSDYPSVTVKTRAIEEMSMVEVCTLAYETRASRETTIKRDYKFLEPVAGVVLHCKGRKSIVTVKQFFLEKYLEDCVEIELLSEEHVEEREETHILPTERKLSKGDVTSHLKRLTTKLFTTGLYRKMQPPLVVAGSAMLLHGLRDSTADIDLQISNDYKDLFVEEFGLEGLVEDLGRDIYRVEYECFDIIFTNSVSSRTNVVWNNTTDGSPLPIQTLREVLDLKLYLNRDKDQDDIILLRRELGK